MNPGDISFPNLNLIFHNVPKTFTVFGFPIALYGCIIGVGMLLSVSLAAWDRKTRGLSGDTIWDLAVYGIVSGIVGARIYYVIFSWEYYRGNLFSILNIRQGGLAIYGGIIGGFLATFIYCRVKKESFPEAADSVALAFPLGQALGRWGNFFNREAFGGWCEGLFAMRLPVAAVRSTDISEGILAHMEPAMEYIQVHPTFLYESAWNLCVLAFLLFYRKKKRFSGEVFFLYLLLYGFGRFWIEGLRTDQLIAPVLHVPVSQLAALLCMGTSLLVLGLYYFKNKNKTKDIT